MEHSLGLTKKLNGVTRHFAQRPKSKANGVERRDRTRFHGRSSEKSGELSTKKQRTLRTTLPQKAERNDALFDLWRRTCCAMMAPGQPQAKPRKISVSSDTRRRPAFAADLSITYVTKHTTLAAKYRPATQFGTRHSMATIRKTTRKAGIAK